MAVNMNKIRRGVGIYKHLFASNRFNHLRCAHEGAQHRDNETHFGFQTVLESEKVKKVHKVFRDVADGYDRMNDCMSFGVHRIWKDIFIHRMSPTEGTKLIDVAGGTGDISFRFLEYVTNEKCSQGCHATVCDINANMLEVGRSRAEKFHYNSEMLSWVEGDAEKLPFADETFDAYTITFGIRNCTHIDKTISEAYRVLKRGGRYMCMEFSQVDNPTLQWAYDQYSFNVIPLMGQLLTGHWQPYQYMVESIRKFPPKGDFKRMIEEAGFAEVAYENLTFGVVAIHSGFKL